SLHDALPISLGGGFCGDLEGADAHEVLVIVTTLEMAIPFEYHPAMGRRIMMTGPRPEQTPGRLVTRRNSGVHIANVLAHRAFEDLVKHACCQALAARFRGNSNLPHE